MDQVRQLIPSGFANKFSIPRLAIEPNYVSHHGMEYGFGVPITCLAPPQSRWEIWGWISRSMALTRIGLVAHGIIIGMESVSHLWDCLTGPEIENIDSQPTISRSSRKLIVKQATPSIYTEIHAFTIRHI